MKPNEDIRVKIPAIIHLTRLGFEYISLKDQQAKSRDKSTNIFIDIFNSSIKRINPDIEDREIKQYYEEVSLNLENKDLGRAFYEKLVSRSGIKLIDFDNFANNSFHVVTELPYEKDDESFRPDITLLINGMPLIFIEVKRPNNQDGVLKEHKRLLERFQNRKFLKFVNITQFMVFSNNMDYNDSSPMPIEGAFYASTSYKKPKLNYFREEQAFDLDKILKPIDSAIQKEILRDNNLQSIEHADDFIVNKSPDTPTHRICNSLFQPARLAFLLEFGLVYVKEADGLQKHIMRYPQLFATKAIARTLEQGIKSGIIWHTQGSGKTALAYFNVKYLSHYFRQKEVIPKFYFIVDRLSLLIQASKEFKARGLVVHHIDSRDDFARDIKKPSAIHNNLGKAEITVVNIQRFADDPAVIKNNDYQLNVQRVFFLDEVHRSYNPTGSFLANLEQADRNSIKIGLTGTPLLGKQHNSKTLFGSYIHKYYYNQSIADGYTLRLIREEIETSYKLLLQKALEEVETKLLKGSAERKLVYAHAQFVEPMLDYIVKDLERGRIASNNNTIGGMVVCDSNEQAVKMQEIFEAQYSKKVDTGQPSLMAAEPDLHIVGEDKTYQPLQQNETLETTPKKASYNVKRKMSSEVNTSALILYNSGTKSDRKQLVEDFKDGKIDILFVNEMLLTGFDAPRLKKLYMGRVITAHNLLQALTRVNRTYENFSYGYVVDFANIEKEFEKTNQDYLKELQDELGDELENYSELFKSQQEIIEEIQEIKEALFHYNTQTTSLFEQQISQIDDRSEMLKITKALNNAKSLYNLIRLRADEELLAALDFSKLRELSIEANNRLALINTKEKLENSVDTTNLLNVAIEDVIFAFTKVKEEEMVLADELRDKAQRTREGLVSNFDPKDPEFISLKEELERLFKQNNLHEVSKEQMQRTIAELDRIYTKAKELERRNQLLRAKYDNDEKYARLHKRLMEKDPLTDSESKLFEALQGLKAAVDSTIEQNSKLLNNESYIERLTIPLVIKEFKNKQNIPLDAATAKRINALVIKEYMNEYYGIAA